MPVGTILKEGKLFTDGKYFDKYSEGLSFDFINYEGCRIVISGLFCNTNIDYENLNNYEMKYILAIDTQYHKFDNFRNTGANYKRIRININNIYNNNLLEPLGDDKDNVKSQPINLSDEKSMDFYRTKQREFPELLTRRIKYQFDNTKIGNDDLLDFFEKYYEKQAED